MYIISPGVEAELGAPLQQLFVSFDERPTAAASIAQARGSPRLAPPPPACVERVKGGEDRA